MNKFMVTIVFSFLMFFPLFCFSNGGPVDGSNLLRTGNIVFINKANVIINREELNITLKDDVFDVNVVYYMENLSDSKEKIDYPKVLKSDILLALTQKACDKYIQNLSEDGILLADSTNVVKIPAFSGKIYQYPITEDAVKVLGNQLVTNIISLGILVQLTHIVSKDAITKAIIARIPARVKDLNLKALEHGYAIGEKI